MSNELTVSVSLTYTNPAQNVSANSLAASGVLFSIQAAPGTYERNVQQVTTSKVPLSLALVPTPGLIVLHNCDNVNSVNVWQNTGITPAALTLPPGGCQLVQFTPGSVPQVQSSAGTVLLEYFAID